MQVNAKLHAEYQAYIDETYSSQFLEDCEPITYQEWLEDRLVSCRLGWLIAGFMSFLCAAIMVLK